MTNYDRATDLAQLISAMSNDTTAMVYVTPRQMTINPLCMLIIEIRSPCMRVSFHASDSIDYFANVMVDIRRAVDICSAPNVNTIEVSPLWGFDESGSLRDSQRVIRSVFCDVACKYHYVDFAYRMGDMVAGTSRIGRGECDIVVRSGDGGYSLVTAA